MSNDFLSQLQNLTAAQFAQLVHELAVPAKYLPQNVSPTEVAIQVLKYVEQQNEGEQRLREVLRKLLPPEPDDSNNPYLGLQFFRTEDKDRFFGRDAVAADLLALLEQNRFVALIGASGSGKSSLLHAGLVPRLPADWLLLVFRPRNQPLAALAQAYLACKYPELSDEERRIQSKRLTTQLDNAELTVTDLVELLSAENVLLLIDQFEELYTVNTPALQQRLVADLLALLDAALPCRLLLSYRADFTAEVIDSFGEVLNQHGKLFLKRMHSEGLQQAIEQPAKQCGVLFEDKLVTRMLHDLGGEPGYLPLLQFALFRLWALREDKLLTHRGYEHIGGVHGALTQYADDVLTTFSAPQQRQIRGIFMQLVRTGEVDTRKVATKEQVSDWELVTQLASKRLLVTGQQDQQDTVEVVHEALIRQWGRMQAWLEEERPFLLWRQGLQRDMADQIFLQDKRLIEAQEWLERRKEEFADAERNFIQQSAARVATEIAMIKKQRQQRRLTGFVMVVALGFIGVAGIFWWNSIENERVATENQRQAEQKVAEARENLTQSQKNLTASIRNQASALVRFTEIELGKNHSGIAMRLALEALPTASETYPQQPFVPEAYDVLFRAINQHYQQGILQHDKAVVDAVFSPDGNKILTRAGNNAYVWDRYNRQLLATLQGHEGRVNSASFNPDGSRIVTASEDNTARLWNVSNGQPLVTLQGHEWSVNSASFSPDGTRIVTASDDRMAWLWNADNGQLLAKLRHNGDVNSASFSPDGTRIVTASVIRKAWLWDANSGQLLTTLPGHDSYNPPSFRPDSMSIVTVSWYKIARLWNANSGQPLVTLQGHDNRINSVSFSPDGRHVATASKDKTAKLWDADSGQLLITLQGHEDTVRSASFSPDGTRIVTASEDKTVRVWETKTGQLLATLHGHKNVIWSALFSPDGTHIVTASKDKTVRLWDAKSVQPLTILSGHKDTVWSASFNPDGKQIVTASEDSTARLWDVKSRQLLATLEGHENRVNSASFSPDGTLIVTASADSTARLWDAKSGQPLATLQGHKQGVSSAFFSSDGTQIVTASLDQTVRLWSIESKQSFIILKNDLRSFSPYTNASLRPYGGSLIITTSAFDKTVRVWFTKSGQLLTTLQGHTGFVMSASFSPDGSRIVTASRDKTARLWDAHNEQPLATLQGHTEIVTSASFSPDGSRIVTASGDKTARLWDVSSGQPLATLQGHTFGVNSASFSPDGSRIVTASSDKTARIWLTFLTLDAMIAHAKTFLPPRATGEAGEEQLEGFRLTCAERKRFFLEALARCKKK